MYTCTVPGNRRLNLRRPRLMRYDLLRRRSHRAARHQALRVASCLRARSLGRFTTVISQPTPLLWTQCHPVFWGGADRSA